MNVLFYSTYHFNTETFGPYLELMQEHINKGDKIIFLNNKIGLSQIYKSLTVFTNNQARI